MTTKMTISTGDKIPAVRLPDLPVGLRWNVKVEESYVYIGLEKHKKTKILNKDKWNVIQSEKEYYWDVDQLVKVTEDLAKSVYKSYQDKITFDKISVEIGGVYEPVKP
jgi:hypothetical protein